MTGNRHLRIPRVSKNLMRCSKLYILGFIAKGNNMSELRREFLKEEIAPIYVGGTTVSISLDGEIVATPFNEDVLITNLNTGETLYRVEGDGELVTSIVMCPNGSKIGIVSQSQQLRIFDMEKMEVIKKFKLSSPVYISAADPTSTLFAFGGSDGVVTVWDIDKNYVTHSFKGHGSTLCSLAFYGEVNSSNWKLASGEVLGTVKIWDLVKRKCINTINEHSMAARGISFSDFGDYFITGGRDELAILYNTRNFKPIQTFSLNMEIECAGFIHMPNSELSNQNLFYTAGSGNVLKIWNFEGKLVAQTKEPIRTTEELVIIDVKFLKGNTIMLVISDQTLIFCDLEDTIQISGLLELQSSKRIAGNHGTIADMNYVGPEFSLLALATNAPALRIIDLLNPLEVMICEGHTDLLNSIDVSSDGLWIATGSKDNTAKIWRYLDGKFQLYATFKGHASSVTAVALPKGNIGETPQFIITASTDLTIKKWLVPKNKMSEAITTSVFTRRAHEKDINAISISPNNAFLGTASFDKTAKVWDIETGETIGVLKGHRRGLWDINFCEYDKLIVTASGDKTIKIWSLTNFLCSKTLQGHTNSVQRAKFFNRNQQIVSSGADGLIKVWDISSVGGDCIQTLDNHDNRIWALDIKSDGGFIASADADGYITTWIDNTEEHLKLQKEMQKEQIEKDQQLSNYISKGDWSNAFLLALILKQSMKLYNVVRACISANAEPESTIGSYDLEDCIKKLDDDQLLALLRKIRDWNINSKLFEIAQKLLSVILKHFNPERLIQIQGLIKIVDSILPYSQRHYQRIDHLYQETFTLDYVLDAMDRAS